MIATVQLDVDDEPGDLAGSPLSDDELTALALAADPDQEPDPDAVPLQWSSGDSLLPAWYMPAVSVRASSSRRMRRTIIVVLIIMAFIALNAMGLCSTYGQVVPA